MKPIFFDSPAAWRAWLAAHHRTAPEVLVGFHKRHTGRPSLTWPESVDEALCYGWIDGVRHSLGAEGYTIRFTPRREGSIWSAVNIRRVGELIRAQRMRAAGLAAWNKRRDDRLAIHRYEEARKATLPPALVRRLKANATAWAFFSAQPPSYRRIAAWWIISPKREETKERRFATLLEDCAAGRRTGQLYIGQRGTRRKPSK